MGEVGDLVAGHLEVDRHGRAAQLGMGGGAGVRRVQPAQPGDIAGQFEDSAVVDLVEHGLRLAVLGAGNLIAPTAAMEYIGNLPAGAKPPSGARGFAIGRSHVKWECGVQSARMGSNPQSAYH